MLTGSDVRGACSNGGCAARLLGIGGKPFLGARGFAQFEPPGKPPQEEAGGHYIRPCIGPS